MTKATDGRLAGRVALITGASRGIGAAVARRFAAEGARVVLAARTVGGLEEVDDAIRTAGGEATLVPVDLVQPGHIDALGNAIFERFGRLDILVGNAAMLGALSPVSHSDPKLWPQVFDLNLTVNYHLIRVFDALLRAAPAGRAVFVTCGAARTATPYWGAYAASKAALEMMVRLYAGETTKTALRVNLVDPGPVATRLRARAFPGEDQSTLPPPDAVTEAFVRLAEPGCTVTGTLAAADPLAAAPTGTA